MNLTQKKIKHVALYPRKSRDNSESLEGQIASLIEYCERYEWEYEIFKEEGSASSEDWDRKELQRMIKLIKKQHFDAVVVTEQSRITRADEFPKFRDILVEANCLFITTQTNSVYDYTKPEDEFVSDIMSAVAKQEIAFAKLRLKRGTIQSAKKGNWLGKKRPIGYDYDKTTKRLVPNEDASVIQRMFQEYIDGYSTKEIAHRFTNEGVTSKAEMIWSPAGVARILSNVAYAGHSLFGATTQKKDKVTRKRITKKTSEDEQILVKNTHTPIVSQKVWDRVQQLKEERNSRPIPLKMAKRKYSGLIKCQLCGRTHSFQHSKGGKLRISSCLTRYYNDDLTSYTVCENGSGNVEQFEKLFFALFKKYINELETYYSEIEKVDKPNQEDAHNRIAFLEKQIKKVQGDIKRVQKGYVMEIFTEEEAQAETKAYKTQIANMEKELEELKQKDVESDSDYLKGVIDKLNAFMIGHDEMPEAQANEILKQYIEAIKYKKVDSEMEIEVVWK